MLFIWKIYMGYHRYRFKTVYDGGKKMITTTFDPANLKSNGDVESFRNFLSAKHKIESVESFMKSVDDDVDIDFSKGKGTVSVADVPVKSSPMADGYVLYKVSGSLQYNPDTCASKSLFVQFEAGRDKEVNHLGNASIESGPEKTKYRLFEGFEQDTRRETSIYTIDNKTGVITEDRLTEYPNYDY